MQLVLSKMCDVFKAYVEACGYKIDQVGDAEECAGDERFNAKQQDWFVAFTRLWDLTPGADDCVSPEERLPDIGCAIPETLRVFTDSDWDGYSGATKLPTGHGPFTGESTRWSVVVSGDGDGGTTVECYDEDGRRYYRDFASVQEALMCAAGVLAADPIRFVLVSSNLWRGD